MSIDDFQTGFQYIMLYGSQFKNKEDFEDIKKFLKVSPYQKLLYIPIDYDRLYKLNTRKRLPNNFNTSKLN